MKYAIMSDVHANPKALETALADARRLGCGKFILLGDVTGYGYDPKATLEIVRRKFDVVLMGNHDSACVELEPEREVRMNYNYDFDRMARGLLTEEDRAWLRGRAYLHEEAGFVCTHGDFTQPKTWNYIFYCEAAEQNFRSIWEQTGKGVCRLKLEHRFVRPASKPESISFKMNQTSRYIVNVGSVGYPRNDLCSVYGIFDADTRRVKIRRLPFDFMSYITEMLGRNLDLPGWLCDIIRAAQGR